MWGEHIARVGRDEMCIHNFVSKPEGKRPLGTFILGCKGNITHLKGVEFCVVGSFNVDKDTNT
jgi:hypothetical protein